MRVLFYYTEEYIQSGKSQTVFAPEYGIKPNTLSAWLTKYKSAEACQAADVHFVELKSTLIKEKQNLIIRKYEYFNDNYRYWTVKIFEKIKEDPKELTDLIEDVVQRMVEKLKNVGMSK